MVYNWVTQYCEGSRGLSPRCLSSLNSASATLMLMLRSCNSHLFPVSQTPQAYSCLRPFTSFPCFKWFTGFTPLLHSVHLTIPCTPPNCLSLCLLYSSSFFFTTLNIASEIVYLFIASPRLLKVPKEQKGFFCLLL